MTTAPRTTRTGHRPGAVGRPVVAAAASVLLAALLLAVVGGVVSGAPAAAGAVVGGLLVLGFFGLGAVVLELVARTAPALSLLVALLTYTLQVVLLGLVFVALRRSNLLGDSLDAEWLGGAVVVATFTWLAAQLVATTRARTPLYDLPPPTGGDGSEPDATGGSAAGSSGGSSGGPRGWTGAKEAGAR